MRANFSEDLSIISMDVEVPPLTELEEHPRQEDSDVNAPCPYLTNLPKKKVRKGTLRGHCQCIRE
jgi:hypothetical protein